MPHPTRPEKINLSCSEHEGRIMELYCETCGKLICLGCALKNQKHHNHEYKYIILSYENYKSEMTPLLEPMEKQLEEINELLEQLKAECVKIPDQQATLEATIHENIRQLREALDNRETKLIGQLHQLTLSKKENLATQSDKIKTAQEQLSSCIDDVKGTLETDSHEKVLEMKTTMMKRVRELTSTFQPDILKPITEADIAFSPLPDIMSACQNHGQVFSPGPPDPSKCHITSESLKEVAIVGQESTALFQAKNFRDELCEEPIELL